MPYRDPIKQKEAQARYYRESKEKYQNRRRSKTNRLRRISEDLKNKTPCLDCGIQYPHYVMDFDHVRGDKKFNIAQPALCSSDIKFHEEISKCEIVCSNCHRHRTFIRLHKSRPVGSDPAR